MSRIEQKELEVIRENLKLDPIKERWTTTYPYKCDPGILKNNRSQALIIMERTEKRLSKDKSAAAVSGISILLDLYGKEEPYSSLPNRKHVGAVLSGMIS